MGLTLSRKLGQRVVINGNITVEVREIVKRGKVRLTIEAPEDVLILREEIVGKEINDTSFTVKE
jgi:carbon storage regulator CsrA